MAGKHEMRCVNAKDCLHSISKAPYPLFGHCADVLCINFIGNCFLHANYKK